MLFDALWVWQLQVIKWVRQEAYCLRWHLQFIHDNTDFPDVSRCLLLRRRGGGFSGEEKPGFGAYLSEDRKIFEGVLIINILIECERQERKDMILPVNVRMLYSHFTSDTSSDRVSGNISSSLLGSSTTSKPVLAIASR